MDDGGGSVEKESLWRLAVYGDINFDVDLAVCFSLVQEYHVSTMKLSQRCSRSVLCAVKADGLIISFWRIAFSS
jgi:hypothetical protein